MAGDILILADSLDRHADHMVQKIRMHGVRVVRLNPADILLKARLTFACSTTNTRRLLEIVDDGVELDTLRSIWYRYASPPVLPDVVRDQTSRDVVVGETVSFTSGLWQSLDCLWLPGRPTTVQRAQYKISQLTIARALGFDVPPSLVTNVPEEFLEFYRQCNGKIVSKVMSPAFQSSAGATFSRYTEIVSAHDLGYVDAVRHCPVMFQAYVPKRAELRITVVGHRVFAAEIRSQQTHRTRHDWRRYNLEHTPHLPHELPARVHEQCVRLTHRLGLCYGAIDMILTPDGRYVFLEINPAGQSLWIEQTTGLPISDAICDLLIAGKESDLKEVA